MMLKDTGRVVAVTRNFVSLAYNGTDTHLCKTHANYRSFANSWISEEERLIILARYLSGDAKTAIARFANFRQIPKDIASWLLMTK
ncbi:hypothetical protein X798_05686 [Onchocerca flexuosa]|uniref:Uncharacterized protein n=1 Tax=Onchocerca flexuosa TaxID=387005 RepID=A0A238BRM1_9BILA|nr:hypothetical protein X798_05686 [Onchocerca flexuosa]